MTLLRRLAPYSWIAVLISTLLFIAADSTQRIAHLTTISDVSSALVQPPATNASSLTGYENGLRQVILPHHAIDGYHWLMQTQQMFATGELRIRHVDYDNASDGREVHWASPFRWWLGILAWTDHQLSGLPIGQCVERAGLYASPALLAFFLLITTPLIARRTGARFTAWLIAGLAASLPFYDYFIAGNADHHGAAAACAIITVLGLIAGGGGWISTDKNLSVFAPPDRFTARRWFIVSGLAGALGLWISAASEAPVLVAVGLGALCAGRLKNPSTSASSLAPELWRLWSRCGAVGSVAAWLVEYFPSHLSWRLEVNHPLYALAWWGGGELLFLWWKNPRLSAFARAVSTPISAAALLGISLLPLIIFLGGQRVFRIGNPFLWALHHEYISEFQSLPRFFATQELGFLFWSSLPPLLLIVPALYELLKKTGSPETRSLLFISALPALVFMLMAATQVRWIGFAHVLIVLLVATYRCTQPIPISSRARLGHRAFAALALVMITPQLAQAWHYHRHPSGASKNEIMQLATREVAHWLNRRVGTEPAVVATSPGLSTMLAFHGSAKTLGTLYWENLAGLETSAAFFGARTEADAFRIVQATGLTHLVLVSWDDFVEPYVKLIRGLKKTDDAPADAFVLDLLHTKVPPPWLRPIVCVLPANPGLTDATVFIFEVVPPQSREESLVRLVNFLIDSDDASQAAKFLPALEQYPEFVPAQISRARLHLLREDKIAFIATMRTLLANPQTFIPLVLEDRVQLALLLAVIGLDAEARNEFERCWSQVRADTTAFRRLPPSAIVYLFQQSARLNLTVPAGLTALARSLLPPQWLATLP